MEVTFTKCSCKSICDFECGERWYLKWISERMGIRAQFLCKIVIMKSNMKINSKLDLVNAIGVFAHILNEDKKMELSRKISSNLNDEVSFMLFGQTGPYKS